jgi:parallel beta-helix repeat protein
VTTLAVVGLLVTTVLCAADRRRRVMMAGPRHRQHPAGNLTIAGPVANIIVADRLAPFRTLLLGCLAVLGPAAAAARTGCTVNVSPGDDLQRAFDGATARRTVVCLGAGEFRLRRFLSITRDGTILRGGGASTVVRLEEGTQSPVIVIGDWESETPRRATSNVTIERLRIVGGGKDGDEAFPGRPYLTNSAVVVRTGRDVSIRDVSITACRSACILTERDTRRLTIEHDDVSGSVWDGIALNRTSHAHLVGNTIHDNTAAGISTEHLEDSLVENNVVRDNRTHGLYLSDSYRNTFAGNRFAGNVISGVFLTCAVRHRDPPPQCWPSSMSAGNVFERDRFVDNRVGYMVGADRRAPCTGHRFVANVSRVDAFVGNPREDSRATAFGRCLVYGTERVRPERVRR